MTRVFLSRPGLLFTLMAAAAGLSGCSPPAYRGQAGAGAGLHPDGHPDWDWFCPDGKGAFFSDPAVKVCWQPWQARPDGPTARALVTRRAQKGQQDETRAAAMRQRLNAEVGGQRPTATLRADISRRGYRPMSFVDLMLDFKSLQDNEKLAIQGYYEHTGGIDIVTGNPNNLATMAILATQEAPRSARKALLECMSGGGMRCRATFLVHVGCPATIAGADRADVPCLFLDDVARPLR